MKQLSTIDNMFITLEDDRHPMHIGLLCVYESTDPDGNTLRFKDVLATFRDRLPLTPILRSKLKKTPFGVDNPYWIDDGKFDLEYHVRHIALPKPGDFRQLSILAARIWARPLDLTRPPWEAYIIEGLDHVEGIPAGSFAMLFKMHYSAADGLSTNDALFRLHSRKPVLDTAYCDHFDPEEEPGTLELLTRAYLNMLRTPVDFWQRYREARKNRIDKRLRLAPKGAHTRFNQPVKANRVFLSEIFRIDDLKAIKNVVRKATINDVVIAICSGAMRMYLKDKDELPETTMSAGVPISTRLESDKFGGNRVNFMNVSLCSHIEDPLERLRAIHQDIEEHKEYRSADTVRQQSEFINGLPSSLLSVGVRVATMEALQRGAPPLNTVITNVPGPQEPLYFCGSKMLRTYGMGCPADNIGIFHTVTSYCGELAISPISCLEMIPDPDFYGECMRNSFKELYEATVGPVIRVRKSVRKKSSPSRSAGTASKRALQRRRKSAAQSAPRKISAKKISARKTAAT